MEALLRMALRRVGEQAEIGEDQRVGAQRHGIVDGPRPDLFGARMKVLIATRVFTPCRAPWAIA
jgi:hypothetical protein